MKLVGLVSCYREGSLTRAAVESLQALDHVLVCEGPVEGAPPSGSPSWLPEQSGHTTVLEDSWATDAAKRTAMVAWCNSRPWLQGEPVWGLWLDGDERLLYGEHLRDWLERVAEQGDEENPAAGWPISLVELDGSVVWCMGKCVRIDLIRRYVISSSYLELVNGREIGVGNVSAWSPLTGALQLGPSGRAHWRARPPLHGEPHLLHLPLLRSAAREVERQHVAEERNFRDVELPRG